MGYDAAVYKAVGINRLISLANRERRILVTRSKKVFKLKQTFNRILITREHYQDQLQEMKKYIELNEANLFARCSECNAELFEIDKDKIKDLIPEYVFSNFSRFLICRRCGRIYWQGSHYHQIRSQLHKIFG